MNRLRTFLLVLGIAALAFMAGTWAVASSAQETTTDTTTLDTHTPMVEEFEHGPRGEHGGPRGAEMLGRALVEATASETGLDHQAIVEQLRTDQTSLAAIATANGSSEQAVIDSALAEIETRLSEAVTNGRITETEKSTALTAATEKAPEWMQREGAVAGPGGPDKDHGPRGAGHLLDATATVTGLTRAQVRAEVETGKSLQQVAEAHGKTGDDIIAELETRGQTKLDDMLAKAREAITVVPER